MKMSLIRRIKKLVGKNAVSALYHSLWFLSDESFVKLVYRLRLGRRLNLQDPKTFTEKLQWLKVYDHKPEYTEMADKLAMRDYVDKRLGPGHTVPVLGVWEKFEDIDFNSLPQQFVLKTTHDSGSFVICRNKDSFDRKSAGKILSKSLRNNYYKRTREWQYKDIKPRIIAEEYIDDGSGAITDCKYFCFNGKPEFMYFEQESLEKRTQAIADMSYRQMPFKMEDDKAPSLPEKPVLFEKMAEYAAKLSEGIPFLRVDMYYVGSKVYIGELTFCHFGGYTPFDPVEWDGKLGDLLDLGKVRGSMK